MNTIVHLFNQGYDYASRCTCGTYLPRATKRNATHALVATRWNVMERRGDWKKLYRDYRTRPDGYALSVVAEPLRKARLPRFKMSWDAFMNGPGYASAAPLDAKRRILSAYAKFTHPRSQRVALRKRLKSAGNHECDQIWRQVCRAARVAKT